MSTRVHRNPPANSEHYFDEHPRQTSGHAGSMGGYNLTDIWGGQGPYKTDPTDGVSVASRPLPSAWHGESDWLRTVIEDKIPDGDVFISTVILPMRRVRNTKKFRFDQLIFNPHIVQPGPEETAPPLVTSRMSSKKAYVERYQLGIKVEHGFAETEAGREQWAGGFQQIITATQRFCELRGLSALLRAKNFAYQWQQQHGIAYSGKRQEMSWANVKELEVWMTGALQKYPNSLQIIVGMAKKTMGAYGVYPKALIVSQAMEFYVQHAREEILNVMFSGGNSSAQLTKKERPISVLPDVKMAVFTAKPISVRADAESIMLLSRWRRYGGYVIAVDSGSQNAARPYRSSDRTIERYDEKNDKPDPIDLEKDIANCRRFNDGDGRLNSTHQLLADKLNADGGVGQYARSVDEEQYYKKSRGAILGSRNNQDGLLQANDGANSDMDENEDGDGDDDDGDAGNLGNESDSDDDGSGGGGGGASQARPINPSGSLNRTPENKLVDWSVYWAPSANSPNEGTYRVIKRFGDIEPAFLSRKVLSNLAESAQGYFNFDQVWKREFADGMDLMTEINAAVPNDVYWKGLMDEETNAKALAQRSSGHSVNLSGGDHPYGIFNLCERQAKMPALPFGYANYAGMSYLASKEHEQVNEKGNYMGWNMRIFVRAGAFMRAFEAFFAKCKVVVGESPFFNPTYRFANNVPHRLNTETAESKQGFFDQLFKDHGGAIFFKVSGPSAKSSSSSGTGNVEDALSIKGGSEEEKVDKTAGGSGSGSDKAQIPGRDGQLDQDVQAYEGDRERLFKSLSAKTDFGAKTKDAEAGLLKQLINEIIQIHAGRSGTNHDQFVAFDKAFLAPLYNANKKIKFSDLKVKLANIRTSATKAPTSGKEPAKSTETMWLVTPLTHPASTHPFNSQLAAISDLSSIHLLKPQLLNSANQDEAFDSFERSAGRKNYNWATSTNIRNPLLLPVHTYGTKDVVGDRYRSSLKKTGAKSRDDDDELAFPSLGSRRTGSSVKGPAAKKVRKTAGKSSGLGMPRFTGPKVSYGGNEEEDEDLDTGFGEDDDDEDDLGANFYTAASATSKAKSDASLSFRGTLGGGLYSTPNMRQRHNMVEAEPDHISRVFLHLFLSLEVSSFTLTRFVTNHIRVPLNFLICNPYITRKMDSMIVVVPGDSTGSTLWGFSSFEVGDDPRTGVSWGSYNVYLASIVHTDKNVMVLRDVFMAGYGGGAETVFFRNNNQFKTDGNHTAQTMVFAEPATQTEFPTCLDLSGQFQASAVGPELMRTIKNGNKMHHSAATFYNVMYGGFNARQENAFTGKFFAQYEKQNSMCWQDWQRVWDTQQGAWKVIPNKGHAGSTFVGVAKYRAGLPLSAPLHSDDPTYRGVQVVASG